MASPLRHAGTVTNLRGRLAPLALVAILGGVLSACSPPSLTVLRPATDVPLDDAEAQAARLVELLEQIELSFSVADPERAGLELDPDAAVADATVSLAETHALSGQARAYATAHATHARDQWASTPRPTDVSVAATDVTVAGRSAATDPIAGVTVQITYEFASGPDMVVSGDYATSWTDGAGAGVPGGGTGSASPAAATPMLEVYPLYRDGTRPALDSGTGARSPLGSAREYVRAVARDGHATLDRLEGTVHSSEDLREEVSKVLAALPRYTLVEIPLARTGTQHTVYVVQDDDEARLRLDVTIDDDGPVVTALL